MFFAVHPCFAQREVLSLDEFSAFKSGKQVYLRFVVSAGNTCEGIRIWRGKKGGNFEVIFDIPGVCGSDSTSLTYIEEDSFPVFNQSVFYRLQFGGLGFSDTIQSFFINTDGKGHLLMRQESEWRFYFENPFSDLIECSVFDLQGRNWFQAQTRAETLEIPTKQIPEGMSVFWLRNVKSGQLSQGRWIK